MAPSGSNGSDTNFGPIAIKGSGHETGQQVNGAPVELLVSQPTLTVSILLCQLAAKNLIFKEKLCIPCNKPSLQFAIAVQPSKGQQ